MCLTINPKRAWIFVNGDFIDYVYLRRAIRPGDLVVSANGGLRHLRRLGLLPDWVVGDLDSLDADQKDWLRDHAVQVEQHPPEKNETDLELALARAVREGYEHIRIVAAQGARLDHTLANLFLLTQVDLRSLDVRLDDGREEVFLIEAERTVEGAPGDLVSLLPLGGSAAGVTTTGLYYPLEAETLFADRTRGISNILLGERATVSLDQGRLICIHTRSISRSYGL